MLQQPEADGLRHVLNAGDGVELLRSLPSSLDRSHMLALLRLGDFADDAFVATALDGRITYMNRAAGRLLGIARSAMSESFLSDFIQELPRYPEPLEEPGKSSVLTWSSPGIRTDGIALSLEGASTLMIGLTGPCYLYIMRARRAETDEDSRQDQLAALVYRNTSEGMLVLDPKGIILDINPAFVSLRGQHESEVIGRHVRLLNSPCHDRDFYRAMWRSVIETGSWQGEHWGQHKNGELYPEWLSINTSYTEEGQVYRRIMIFSNIAEIKRAEAIIWKQANYDKLTDLPNRQMFYDRLEQSIKKSQRSGTKVGLMFLDLDRFKEINDTLGHAIGDELLKEAARRLSACVRQSDTVARLGGDEFTVLVDDITQKRDLDRLSKLILLKLSEPFQLGLETVFISTSIGITFYPDDGKQAEVLLNNADQAMYVAKSEGRNRSCYFDTSMQERAQTRMRLVNDLHLALAQNQFSLVFQPIVELATGKITKAETLLRWQHPVRGAIPPVEFIPLAEETGMIAAIGDWVFCEATRQAHIWRARYLPQMQLSVNISPVQFRHEGIDLGFWLSHLETMGMSGTGVTIEITEGILLDSNSGITEQLKAFRNAGIQVSLDDFGTGYSSLSYLRKFNIDYLKIDQSFVSNLGDAGPDLALCEAIILMAHKLGLKVVAEGIETSTQYELLCKAGCDYGQGFLFSKPLSARHFEALLEDGGDIRPGHGA
ncbi:EAL domain-containing protein [Alcaligenaceae bacterium CGII-47]|nr:EAL domain-containing protein [Alcaligenaceae bacterium CGII-47]